MHLVNIEKLLETYTLAEILEYNDVTEEEVLSQLRQQEDFHLPPIPVDSYEET